VDELAATCISLGPSSVCSPAVVPSVFNNSYFSQMVQVCNELVQRLVGSGISSLQTAIVSLQDLSTRGRALEVASILSQTNADRLYLVLLSTVSPRGELKSVEDLKGAMRLINALEACGIRILVGFCSSDIILWKAAGATACASGKYFNLRRFTPSRWDDDQASGGGQIAYWFEESLFAFLRQSDVLRAAQRNLLSTSTLANPFSQQIMQQLSTEPNVAWLKLSWRQFLYWFTQIERRIGQDGENPDTLLLAAENNWLLEPRFLLEEPRNNGDWVRPWRIALQEFAQY
jgi:hypothetical protein